MRAGRRIRCEDGFYESGDVNCPLTFTIVVTNAGPAAASQVVLTDVLPAGMNLVSASTGCVSTAPLVQCDLGTLAAGESTTVTLSVVAVTTGTLTNVAAVAGCLPDPDLSDNYSTVVLTVEDLAAPSITCPDDVVTSNDQGRCDATIEISMPIIGDNCLTNTVSVVRSDGLTLADPFPVGTTTVTWTVTDAAGNSSSCQQTVTVNDVAAPSITCPADVVTSNDAERCDATVEIGSPTVADNCGVTPRRRSAAMG